MSSLSNLLNPVNRKLQSMSPSDSPVPILSQPPSSPESTASEDIPPTHRRRHLHQQPRSPDDLHAEEDHDIPLEADGDEDGRLRGNGHGLGRPHHHHRHPPPLVPEREQELDREQLEEDEQDDPPEPEVEVEIDPELQQEPEPEDIIEDHDQDAEQDPDMPDIQDHGLPHVPNIPHNPDHRPHPNCPDTLACLPDTEGRPQHTLPVILRCAILGSPRKRLTIREIYAAMEGKYAYYRTAGQTWKQSVRHHLSLNRLFERQPRPVTDPGFGSYWTVNLAAPPGTKRPRKRGRPNKNKEGATTGTGARTQPPNPTSAGATPLAVKELDLKRRGRPRKDSEPPPLTGSSSGATNSDILMHGRSEDELVESDEERNVNQIMHPFERRSSLVGLTPYPTGGGAGGTAAAGGGGLGTGSESSSPTFDSGNVYATIEKLQNEIASLRQQANDAVQLSMRLSDQLAQAHAEASRAKTNLRNVETLLEEEAGKRMDAERLCVEEGKMKREAQDMLRAAEVRRREAEERWLASRDLGMEA